ncbi:MAG: indole-3-glycerol phosphate synthase TrpC [Saprospiraceae bacterium]|nr:indole-3-glycerol phosphate synthase TrpC [Saprospiraceae bacterium]
MNILEKIAAEKRRETEERKSLYPTKLLERSIYFETPIVSLKKYLSRTDKSGIIAEFKRKSPSKGMINAYASVEEVTIAYMQAGASALSVLTDEAFFGGTSKDLITARQFNFCPILRKDFVLDEYQILESKSIGADAVLLIAACLTKNEVKTLTGFAHSLGLEVLLELHDESEIGHIPGENVLVGINNRNLQTMQTDVETSFRMIGRLPSGMVKVSESGISNAEKIGELRAAGFQGFLIGEYFMQSSDPGARCKELTINLKQP